MTSPTTAQVARGSLYRAIAQAEFKSAAEKASSTISIYQAIQEMLASGESSECILDLVQVISSEFSV